MINNYPVISLITRTPASPLDTGTNVGIPVSPGMNFYNVQGNNLDKIISISWNTNDIKFKINTLNLYSKNLASFSIIIEDNFNNASMHPSTLNFKREDGTVICFPVTTYGNLGLRWNGPFSGKWEFET